MCEKKKKFPQLSTVLIFVSFQGTFGPNFRWQAGDEVRLGSFQIKIFISLLLKRKIKQAFLV
jgi:hypothetical protein